MLKAFPTVNLEFQDGLERYPFTQQRVSRRKAEDNPCKLPATTLTRRNKNCLTSAKKRVNGQTIARKKMCVFAPKEVEIDFVTHKDKVKLTTERNKEAMEKVGYCQCASVLSRSDYYE